MILTRSLSNRGSRSDPNGVAKPQLTSLIDVLTILLVFLLKSFSMEGNLVTPAEDLVLPESINRERPVPTLNVEITTHGINVDGEQVALLSAVTSIDSMLVDALYERLQQVSGQIGVGDEKQEVTIQCDKRLDFGIVKKVMYTCAKANYADFAILALREEQ
jgi:biopolymer transport protein ExbD